MLPFSVRFGMKFTLLALAAAIALNGCSSSSKSNAAPGCSLESSGNVIASEALPSGCGAVTSAPVDDAGTSTGYVLTVSVTSKALANLDFEVDLGPSPELGSLTSEGVTDWNAGGAAGEGGADAGSACTFGAGSAAVPAGSFTLDLTSLDVGADTAHGTVSLNMYVHAAPSTDCGAGDLETVVLSF